MKVKNLWAIIMTVALAVGSLGGCGNSATSSMESSSQDGTDNVVSAESVSDEEKITLTYWIPMNSSLAQVEQSYDNTLYYQELQERLNIDIEFQHPPVGQESEQFQLMIASGELPDLIDVNWGSSYPGGAAKAIEDGIIIPLNDYMDQMPNYKESFESNELNIKEGTTDAGDIYGFYTLQTGERSLKVMQAMMLRMDWLEEMNLELPETIAEWEIVLETFKQKEGVEYPLTMTFNDLKGSENFNTAYKVGNSFYVDDEDRVQYGPSQEAYKEYLTTLNRWYENGYLDPDFASIDGAYVTSQILNGKAGVSYAWIGAGLGSWLDAATEEGFSMEGVANPVSEKGEEAFLAASLNANLGATQTCVTTVAAEDEKKMEAITRLFDYVYSDEGLILRTYGVEGETFEMVDGEPIYMDIITDNPDGLDMAQALAKYTQAAVSGPGYGMVEGYVDQYYQHDEQKNTMYRVNEANDIVEKHTYPAAQLSTEEADEYASIMAEVEPVKDEQMIAFITGVRPLDEFDDFVEELKALGIDRAVELKQATLDRFNSK